MALTTSRAIVVILVLVAVLVPAAPKSLSYDLVNKADADSLVRQRRQLSLPIVSSPLGTYISGLLLVVGILLVVLSIALPIILPALGLGGLSGPLSAITGQLGIAFTVSGLTSLLGLKKRRDTGAISLDSVNAQLADAGNAANTVNGLTSVANQLDVSSTLIKVQSDLQSLLADLTSGTSPLATIQSTLSSILSELNPALTQVQSTVNILASTARSNLNTIIQALNQPATLLLGTVSQLTSLLSTTINTAIGSVASNVATAQNIAINSLNNIEEQLFAITNATTNALLMSTSNMGKAITQTITQCT